MRSLSFHIISKKQLRTEFNRSFISGASSIFNIAGSKRIPKILSPADDVASMREDWKRIGIDLNNSLRQVVSESK